jgi:hypothetical protein
MAAVATPRSGAQVSRAPRPLAALLARQSLIATPGTDPQWATLCRTGAVCALVTVAVIPIAIVSHVVWPPPAWAAGAAANWFDYLTANPVAGLLNLDLAMLGGLVASIPLYLALYVALKPAGPTLALVASATALLGTLFHILSNTAFELLALSQSHAAAATDAQRQLYVAAGEAALSAYYGTVFQVSYVLGYAAYAALGAAMLRSSNFDRPTAYLGLATGIAGFGFYLPVVGLALSVFVVLLIGAWNVLVARHLLRLARALQASPALQVSQAWPQQQ